MSTPCGLSGKGDDRAKEDGDGDELGRDEGLLRDCDCEQAKNIDARTDIARSAGARLIPQCEVNATVARNACRPLPTAS